MQILPINKVRIDVVRVWVIVVPTQQHPCVVVAQNVSVPVLKILNMLPIFHFNCDALNYFGYFESFNYTIFVQIHRILSFFITNKTSHISTKPLPTLTSPGKSYLMSYNLPYNLYPQGVGQKKCAHIIP